MNGDVRYRGHISLCEIDLPGQKRISGGRVLIVGAGGLGSPACLYLAAAGVGHIAVLDPDTVSLSNLQRQVLYSEAQVGESKAAHAAARLRELNSEVEVEAVARFLTAENAEALIAGHDLLLDCTDTIVTRYLIDDACAAIGTPWVYASIGEFAGQLAVFNGAAGTRYRDLYGEREELCGRPKPVLGVLGAVAGVMGAMQAGEAVKYMLGLGENLDGRLFTIDLLSYNTMTINI